MPESGGEHRDESTVSYYVGRLLDDTKTYAKAETDLVKAHVQMRAEAYRRPVILAFVALVLVICTLMAVASTLVLVLSWLIGPLFGGLLAILLLGGVTAGVGYWAYREFEAANDK